MHHVLESGEVESPTEATEEVVQTLYLVQDAILRYPMVMQAAFSALVAEGRVFAETEEGRALAERLHRSRSAGKGRLIWEMLTTNGFEERPVSALPTVFLERLVRTIATSRIESVVARLFQRTP